jgi:hypothetical protein
LRIPTPRLDALVLQISIIAFQEYRSLQLPAVFHMGKDDIDLIQNHLECEWVDEYDSVVSGEPSGLFAGL